jgi:drug/metabolite transporter (DMT)-like permease
MFTVLIACLVLGETLTRTDVAAAIAILLGLFLASYRPPERGSASSGQPLERSSREEKTRSTLSHGVRLMGSSGFFLALFGSFSYAVSNVLQGLAIRDRNEPVLGVLGGSRRRTRRVRLAWLQSAGFPKQTQAREPQ